MNIFKSFLSLLFIFVLSNNAMEAIKSSVWDMDVYWRHSLRVVGASQKLGEVRHIPEDAKILDLVSCGDHLIVEPLKFLSSSGKGKVIGKIVHNQIEGSRLYKNLDKLERKRGGCLYEKNYYDLVVFDSLLNSMIWVERLRLLKSIYSSLKPNAHCFIRVLSQEANSHTTAFIKTISTNKWLDKLVGKKLIDSERRDILCNIISLDDNTFIKKNLQELLDKSGLVGEVKIEKHQFIFSKVKAFEKYITDYFANWPTFFRLTKKDQTSFVNEYIKNYVGSSEQSREEIHYKVTLLSTIATKQEEICFKRKSGRR